MRVYLYARRGRREYPSETNATITPVRDVSIKDKRKRMAHTLYSGSLFCDTREEWWTGGEMADDDIPPSSILCFK
jgi:hypothetical protein